MKHFFSLVGLLCVAVTAFGCPNGEEYARAGFSAVYDSIRAVTLGKLQAVDPAILGVSAIDAEETVVKIELDYGNRKTVLSHTYLMGFADHHYLSYDTQVEEPFRNQGLFQLMLAHFLIARPDVTHTEAQLLETSEVAFLIAFMEGRSGQDLIDRVRVVDPQGSEVVDMRKRFARAVSHFDETEDVIQIRNRILRAALANPISRAQLAVTMGKLKRVIVALPRQEERHFDIRLEFDRGALAEADHDKVEVVLAELGDHESIRGPQVPYLRLLPSGLYQQGSGQLLH